MNVLIGCEKSQIVCMEFRKRGHDAYSCDLDPCTGGRPWWHLQMNVFDALKLRKWDLMIAHPPCTHLAVSGAAWFKIKQADGRQQAAIDFFLKLWNCDIPKIALENPIGIMSTHLRKPDQIIEPYYFGDPHKKPTCLWLKGLPKLTWDPAKAIKPELITMTSKKTGRTRTYSKWEYEASCNQKERQTIRSKTFPGIAKAIADQWTREYTFQQ